MMLGKILLVLMLGQTPPNVANGVIRGQILLPSVRASERIQVVVQRSDGPIVARVFSDSLGHYEARSLPMDPGLGDGQLMLANLYMRQRRWPAALERLDAYLAENPNALDRAQIQATRTQVSTRLK